MGGCRPEEHVTDRRSKKMEETIRRQRRMEGSSEGGQDPKGVAAREMNGWIWTQIIVSLIQYPPDGSLDQTLSYRSLCLNAKGIYCCREFCKGHTRCVRLQVV